MTTDDHSFHRTDDDRLDARALVLLTLVAAAAGVVAGFMGGAFRWLLTRLDAWRVDVVDWSDHHGPVGWLVPLAISAAAAAAATWIAIKVPRAAGSGIQHVEAVERGQAEPPTLMVVPARFVGGLLSIGVGGLVLGREGPTVHMAAAIGAAAGRFARATTDEIRGLQTVLSGAGLAVAFNAPIGGAMFVFEEVAKKVRIREVVWTLAAVATAVTCSRVVLGDMPDFKVSNVSAPALGTLPLFIVFGVLVGLLGVGYNWLIRACLSWFEALHRIPAVVKAAAIGATIGALLLISPDLAGGGDSLTQRILDGHRIAILSLLGFLAIRFVAGPLSYSAGTPGGLFAPMLALGALSGLLFAWLINLFSSTLATELALPLVLVGMSSLFASVVRAPFTGIILVIEMTTVTSAALPMLAAGAGAVVIASLVRSPPIYDDLRERMLRADKAAKHPPSTQ